jgi:hypothetical protein
VSKTLSFLSNAFPIDNLKIIVSQRLFPIVERKQPLLNDFSLGSCKIVLRRSAQRCIHRKKIHSPEEARLAMMIG